MAKLDGKLDAIIEHIIEGETFTNIAVMFFVSIETLYIFLNKSENQARAREAVMLSAHTFEEKAEQALKDIPDDATMATVMRQKELAQHYRYRASKRNPATFGDKPEPVPQQPYLIEPQDLKLLAAAINK